MNKQEFTVKLGELLKIAKPHLISCEYEEDQNSEYVIITCNNGRKYIVDVTADSLFALALDVFTRMNRK